MIMEEERRKKELVIITGMSGCRKIGNNEFF